jgi:hypothetical protein
MIRLIQYSIFISIFCIFVAKTVADDNSNSPISVYPHVCQEGIYSQHKGSFFKLAVFCDDAAGTNIGVIFHSVGNKDWYWQELQWSQDVTAFWWSPGYKFLYVSTSGIYGSGAVYELDLVNRKARKALPKGYPPTAGTYTSEIMRYNTESNSLECKVEYFHRDKKEPVSEIIKIPVK